jgi:hypothetical protein
MKVRRWLAASCLLSLSACATIIHGTRQDVPIVSRPAGADVTVDGKAVGQTPVVARLSRKGGQLIRVQLAGFQPFQLQLKRRISPAVWWDVLCLYYVVPLPIDLGTAGLFEITPDVVAAPLLPTDATRPPVVANDPTGIGFGTRVRLMFQGTDQMEGVFLQATPDSIKTWPRRGSGLLSVPMSSVRQLDRLGPSRHRHTELGAAIGAGAGALTGALFIGMVGAINASFGDNTPHTGDFLAGAAIFGFGGAMEGALVGYFIKGASWEPVRRSSLQPIIGKREVGLAVQLRH